MKPTLVVVGTSEAATGLALLVAPVPVWQLLLGIDIGGVGVPVARVCGIALIGLGVSFWPATPLTGMRVYSVAVTLYLAYLGFAGAYKGVLLWPAVVVHVILIALLFWKGDPGAEAG